MAVWSSPAAVRDCQLSAHGGLTVTERLATLLDTGQFADVTVRVGAGGQTASFKAHRLLLASASQPLYRLVSTVQAGHADASTLRVTDVQPGAFRNVLKYIYTDEVCIDSIMDAFELLKAGKKWNLQKMNGRTINYLDEYLEAYTPDSETKKNEIFNLLLLAQSNSEELFEKCLNVIVKFAKDIIPCEGFLSIDDKIIKRIFGHKDFAYEDQLKLFESIKDWGMNQILQKGLNPSRLHPTIEDLLNYVQFDKIEDKDFMGTILPSECLSRGEVISFFLSRGMNIPRDNITASPAESPDDTQYTKVARFKKGYKLPHKEIYQSHEARFMVEQNVRLLGVGFGFLFSNTDMGVTIHCQGPWERRQWTDITQTYCRVSHEQMTSANLRLMFAEPARLEAKLSYKVLVKITRMTAGSNEVELWGGKEGIGSVKQDDATFYFVKAAVNPNKEVEDRELDTKDGMITELLYVLDDDPPPPEPEPSTLHVRRRSEVPVKEDTPPPKVEESPPSFMRKRPMNFEQSLTDCSTTPTRRTFAATHAKWQPTGLSSSTASSIYPSGNKTPEAAEPIKKPEISTTGSYITRKRPTVAVEVKPAFLRPRVTTPTTTPDSPFGERLKSGGRPSWRTRAKPEEDATTAKTQSSAYGMNDRHSSTTNESKYHYTRPSQEKTSISSSYGRGSSASKETGSNLTSHTTRDTPSYSRYGRAPSATKESSSTSSGYSSSRYSRDSSLSKDKTDTSLYPKPSSSISRSDSTRQSSSNSYRPSRYSTDSSSAQVGADKTVPSTRFGRDRDSSASRYGRDRDSSATRYGRDRDSSTSRYGRDTDSSTSRYGRERDSSTPRYGRERESSTARLGKEREPSTSSYAATSKLGSNTNSSSNNYGSTTNTNRLGRDTNTSTNRFGTQVSSLSSRYGSNPSSTTNGYGTDTKSSVSRFGRTATPYTNGYSTDAKASTTQYGSDKDTTTSASQIEKKPLGKYSSRVRDLSATRYGSYGSSPYTSGTYGSGYSPSKYLSSYTSKYR